LAGIALAHIRNMVDFMCEEFERIVGEGIDFEHTLLRMCLRWPDEIKLDDVREKE